MVVDTAPKERPVCPTDFALAPTVLEPRLRPPCLQRHTSVTGSVRGIWPELVGECCSLRN